MKEKLIMAYKKALEKSTYGDIVGTSIIAVCRSISGSIIKNEIKFRIIDNPPSIIFNDIVESLTELEYNDLYKKTHKRNEEILENLREEKRMESLKLLDEYLND